MDEQRLTESRGPRWTRADDYVAAMARKRTARRNRMAKAAESETARSAAGIWPFLTLLVLIGVLGVAIMVLAFPGSQPEHKPTPPGSHEPGTADRGWFQEAQRDFHR